MYSGIRLDRVRFGYNGSRVFDDLSLVIPGGVASAVLGPNGSGKSTLLGLIARTLRPDSGTVDVGGRDDIALAPQHSRVAEAFPITVAQAVAMGRWRHLGLLKRPSRADRDVVDHWIAELGLDDLRRRKLGDLSGGQRQRALLAQTFAQQAPVVLLDEPTVGLDAQAWDRVAAHIGRLAAAGTTVVAATHDAAMARRCDFCVLLGAGTVLATGAPDDVLTDSNLAAAVALG